MKRGDIFLHKIYKKGMRMYKHPIAIDILELFLPPKHVTEKSVYVFRKSMPNGDDNHLWFTKRSTDKKLRDKDLIPVKNKKEARKKLAGLII